MKRMMDLINQDILANFTLQAASVIPIITAVTQAFKLTGFVKDKYTPFLAMFIGMVVTFLLTHDAMADLSGTILAGILFGLASSGLYSGLQHTASIIRAEKAQKQNKQQQQQQPQKQQQPQQQMKVEHVESTTVEKYPRK
jgi:hypothetical protein